MTKFVYFDVGGVVVKDFSSSNKWKELQYSLGVRSDNEAKFQTIWMKYRDRICVDYDVDKMIPELNSEVGLSIPSSYSLLQGFVDRFEKNQSIWSVIKAIKKHVKIGLLTNMYLRMFDGIQKKGILPVLQWDTIIDSSIVKMQKPDFTLFQLAEKEAGFFGKDILFIDNQEQHVQAAKEFGWQTYLYSSANYEQSSKQLGDFFNHIGIA